MIISVLLVFRFILFARSRWHIKEISRFTEQEVTIERAHRVKTDKSKKGNTPRTNVYRILNYKGKVKVLRNAKKLKGKTFL